MLKVLKRLPQTHSFQFIIILKGWWRRLEAQENKMYPNSTTQEKETLTPHHSNSNNNTHQPDRFNQMISTFDEITPALLVFITSTCQHPLPPYLLQM